MASSASPENEMPEQASREPAVLHAMELALAHARLAELHDDVPVGAVVVRNGEVIAARHNERELSGDPTAHAEVLALRDAAAVVGHWRLHDCTLVVTLEPCAMCAGALVNARIGRVIYGADDPKAGAVRSLFTIADDSRLNHRARVEHGVLAAESSAMLQAFFAARRSGRSGRSGRSDRSDRSGGSITADEATESAGR